MVSVRRLRGNDSWCEVVALFLFVRAFWSFLLVLSSLLLLVGGRVLVLMRVWNTGILQFCDSAMLLAFLLRRQTPFVVATKAIEFDG